jgi:hypothetical protein
MSFKSAIAMAVIFDGADPVEALGRSVQKIRCTWFFDDPARKREAFEVPTSSGSCFCSFGDTAVASRWRSRCSRSKEITFIF